MEDNDSKPGFFSDIRKNFFLIIGGIVSLTTVIPAFLNQTSDIFGWKHISTGYHAFIIIYFIAPYIFYLLYCRIYDYAGLTELLSPKYNDKLNKNRNIRILAEALFVIAIFIYLSTPGYFFNAFISILLILVPTGCFIYFLYQYEQDTRIRALWKEFGMIGGLVILVFGLFFIGTFRQEKETELFPYSTKDQQNTFAAFDLRNNLKKGYLDMMDAARAVTYKYRLQAGGYQPINAKTQPPAQVIFERKYCDNIYNELYAIDKGEGLDLEFVTDNAAKLKASVDDLLAYDKTLTNVSVISQVDENFYDIYNYTVAIQKANLAITNQKWAKELKVLQFKSMCWFFALILLGLCLWFKLQVKLKLLPDNDKPSLSGPVNDNISQVKALILLLFILIVPWFRQLDAKDMDLEKPFLNISLSGLVNGEYHPPVQITTQHTTASSTYAMPDVDSKVNPKDTNQIKKEIIKYIQVSQQIHHSQDSMFNVLNNNIRNVDAGVRSAGRNIGYIQNGTSEFANSMLTNPAEKAKINRILHGLSR